MSGYTLERLTPEEILCNGRLLPVLRTVVHPAGWYRRGCPIHPDLIAVEMVTAGGSRWCGTSQAWIGPDLRMHVLVNPRDEVRSAWEAPAGEEE